LAKEPVDDDDDDDEPEIRIEGTEVGDCTDGADNDGDGKYDCDDDSCAGAPACQGDTGNENQDDTSTENQEDTGSGHDSGHAHDTGEAPPQWSDMESALEQSGLPTVTNQMDESYCEGMQPSTAGATSYFTGIYLLEDGEWRGFEQWILHPTSDWTNTNGQTCYVTWDTIGVETNIINCSDCELALSVTATLNESLTDCPEGLWEDELEFNETYNIQLDANTSQVFFQGSGNLFGQGNSNPTAFNWIAEASCHWF
jgi:hypothetical protein